LAPNQRLQKQKELLGKHGTGSLAMVLWIGRGEIDRNSITSARAPVLQAKTRQGPCRQRSASTTLKAERFAQPSAPAQCEPRNWVRCGVQQSPELRSLVRGPRITEMSRRGRCSWRNFAARRRIGLSNRFSRSSQVARRVWRRRCARTAVFSAWSARVPMDARIVQDG
jgi:hypothetical protein